MEFVLQEKPKRIKYDLLKMGTILNILEYIPIWQNNTNITKE